MARLSQSDAPALNDARLLAEEWIIPDAQSEHNTLARLLDDLRESSPSAQGADRLEVNPSYWSLASRWHTTCCANTAYW